MNMKKFITLIAVTTLALGTANAQYTTECNTDALGTVRCNTTQGNSGGAFLDFGAFQRGAEQANRDVQQRELFNQQSQMQQLLLEQQRMRNDQQRALNNANEERYSPEWQEGIFIRREEGKSADGKSRCVFQTRHGFIFVKGNRYPNFYSHVSPSDVCPKRMSISKFTGSSK
jgi:hypothetical protein